MNGTAYVDFILLYGFTVKIQGNLNTRNTDYYNYQSAVIGDAMAINGSLAKTLYTYKNYTFMQQLLWNETYGEKHHINAILAHENYEYRYDYNEAEAQLHLGNDAEAAKLLEKTVQPYNPSYTCNLTGMALFKEIKKYRKFDLQGEGFNWFDLKRWGDSLVRNTYKNGGSWNSSFTGGGPN